MQATKLSNQITIIDNDYNGNTCSCFTWVISKTNSLNSPARLTIPGTKTYLLVSLKTPASSTLSRCQLQSVPNDRGLHIYLTCSWHILPEKGEFQKLSGLPIK